MFSLNNRWGFAPFKVEVNETFKGSAAKHDPSQGPAFGFDDLKIGYDSINIPRESRSNVGRAYSLPDEYDLSSKVHGFGLLSETNSFTWDDMEVFYYDGKLFSMVLLGSRNPNKRRSDYSKSLEM